MLQEQRVLHHDSRQIFTKMTTTPPMLKNIRGFKDEPSAKVIDATTQSDRDEFEVYLRSIMTNSMYLHGQASVVHPTQGYVGNVFMSDTIRINDYITKNPVVVDEASQKNGSWQYCFLYHPHIKTASSINIIVLPDQDYTVTNTGTTPFTVYIRRYDLQGTHRLDKPRLVNPGQSVNI